jgi:hypothetical protein
MNTAVFRILAVAFLLSRAAGATVYTANPTNYRTVLTTLQPGDTLQLAAGTYSMLAINNLNGTPSAWITITGPTSGAPAVIQGNACCNTVEIAYSSYLAIENLTIDSLGLTDVDGISAHNGSNNLVHDILIQNNTLVGQNSDQQAVGISTKTPTWGWIIRHNQIVGAGTGIYLGNSDGTDPFIGGIIEDNLVENSIGYDLQIKYQITRPVVAGMPTGQSITIIRNNVFTKNNAPSPDGVRPNALVSPFPLTGPGSTDMYEIYGNVFFHNPSEALLQCSGRVSVHDNLFVDSYLPAAVFQAHDGPLQLAYVYNNTIYTKTTGINFGSAATQGDMVTGNLVFAATPISGSIAHSSGNIVDTLANAVGYVNTPSLTLGAMNFYPLANGRAQGPALALSTFTSDTDYLLDFNGVSKTATGLAFRGAYAGQGTNPGWTVQANFKPPAGSTTSTPPPSSSPVLSSLACQPGIVTSGQTITCTVTLAAAAASAATVALSHTGSLTVPSIVTVAAGATSVSFTAATGSVIATQIATLTAVSGVSKTVNLSINPATALPSVASLVCSPLSVVSGAATSCTVKLAAAASAATTVSISLGSTIVTAPASITIASGALSGSLTVTAGSVASSQSVQVTAHLNSSSASAILTIQSSAVAAPVFYLQGDSTELPHLTTGSAVTPTNAPAGLSGAVVVRGSGSAALSSIVNGGGISFNKPGQQQTNTAFLNFSGTPVGTVFNPLHGDLTFYLQSRYSFAQRQALPAANNRFAFDVDNGTTQRLFFFDTYTQSGRLIFGYRPGSSIGFTYTVPAGSEDQLFGQGVTLKVRLLWDGSKVTLYLNDQIVSGPSAYAPLTLNWAAGSSFALGATSLLNYGGGFFACDDVIAGFEMR